MMFNVFKKKEKTTAEEKLERLAQLLFPPFELQTDREGQSFHVDYSVDSNLDAALLDLQDGTNDKVTQSTIDNSVKRLHQAREILQAYSELNKKAKYLLVDYKTDDKGDDYGF